MDFTLLEPTLLDPEPTSVTVGQTATVRIRGRYTGWSSPPSPQVSAGDLKILGLRVLSDVELEADVSSSPTAKLGKRTLRVAQGGSSALFEK